MYKHFHSLTICIVSTYINLSSLVPLMHPYGTTQTFLSGSHRPPTAFTCDCSAVSLAPILSVTRVLSGYFAGGGLQSDSLTMIRPHTLLHCIATAFDFPADFHHARGINDKHLPIPIFVP